MNTVVLQTQRLLLRAYTSDDIPQLLPLISAREIAATTLRIPHPYSQADAEDQVRRSQESADSVRLAICLAASTLIGGAGLRLELDHHRAELGYWIGVPYWGNGYATEAARAMLRYGFDELKLHRIYATYFANNPASGAILRKLGMKLEGCLRSHMVKWEEYHDVMVCGMLKDDCQG
jgi:[ribosomal protein S5]-alanine N-acetyltransferase